VRGIVFHGERQLELVEFPDPTPGPDDVILQMRASGMCGTDLHKYRGPSHLARPEIGGHEPSGVVVAVGSNVPSEWLGRSVMVHHYVGCWRCDQCRSGWTQLCREGSLPMGHTSHGSHADLMCVPFQTILPMPEGLSFLAAAAIGCGTGTAWGALERLGLRGTETLVIFGQGPVGLAATQLATAQGARVIGVDISAQRLDRARDFGADAVINPDDVESVADAVRELTAGRGAAKSLDTSGASSAANAALDVLDTWGTACWVGVGSTIHFDVTQHLYRQITALTSWTMSVASMERCADFVVARGIDVDALFTERWSLPEYQAAYELFDKQTSGKGVFLPND
jgi:threonine dehydrogenase-like Zn-dependent dehydrogenase